MPEHSAQTRGRSVLYLAGAVAVATVLATSAQAQTVYGSQDTSTVFGDQSAANGDTLDDAIDSFEASGGVRVLDRPVYSRFIPSDRIGSLPGPVIDARHDGGVGPIPEPASWLTMLFGFGAVGFALRRRARRPVRA